MLVLVQSSADRRMRKSTHQAKSSEGALSEELSSEKLNQIAKEEEALPQESMFRGKRYDLPNERFKQAK